MATLLLKISQLSILIYGFFIALSLTVGILFAKHTAKSSGVDQAKIMDLCVYFLLAAIFGSRLVYIILNPGNFLTDPLEILKIWKGGLDVYGGLVTALATGLIYVKKVNLPLWKTADIFAPSIVIGHVTGKLGCFFAGCNLAKPYESPWSVSVTRAFSIIPKGAPLQPVHLYSALNSLLIFGILLAVRRYNKFDGQVLWICVLLFGITRSLIELYNPGIRNHNFYGIFSPSQLLGGLMAIIAVVMLAYLSRKAHEIED
jgi:phosphatidylglycerol:prolipoprotein diacylglycerol transferase